MALAIRQARKRQQAGVQNGLEAGLGFDTAHLKIFIRRSNGAFGSFVLTVPHHLTPHEIVLQLLFNPFKSVISKPALSLDDEATLKYFCNLLQRNRAVFKRFRDKLTGYLGRDWEDRTKDYDGDASEYFIEKADFEISQGFGEEQRH